jgi:mRNA interferase RelE/StbE
MLKLKLSSDADAFLATTLPKHQRQIVAKVQSLRNDPVPPDSIVVKGTGRFRRASVGEYRVVYRVEDDVLFVALIGKRNDDEVYRRFGKQ